MLAEIFGMLGRRMPHQVGRRCAGGKVQRAHAPRHQAGFLDLAAPDGAVDALLHQVRAPLAAREHQLHTGMTLEELRKRPSAVRPMLRAVRLSSRTPRFASSGRTESWT